MAMPGEAVKAWGMLRQSPLVPWGCPRWGTSSWGRAMEALASTLPCLGGQGCPGAGKRFPPLCHAQSAFAGGRGEPLGLTGSTSGPGWGRGRRYSRCQAELQWWELVPAALELRGCSEAGR